MFKSDRIGHLPLFAPLQQFFARIPLPQTEESIWLRVLVQALVIVGIVATDIAAEDTQMSLWAIPLSIVGAFWSWYRRRKRNVTTKFVLAIAMLFALASFFENIFANLNDTRLVLAQLLVQLQVIHSFHLPQRKDLGYSMVIGLILLGVAGTISQTLAFAPFLLLFLAIALPVLVLDYRSRLNFPSLDFLPTPTNAPRKTRLNRIRPSKYSPLSPQRLFVLLLVVVGLGLAIFALMPRFPGYQLQTLPVSSPVDLDNVRFDPENRGIVNPGSTESEEGSGGVGQNPSEGAGEVDETYYYGFDTKINQNLRGQLKPKVLLRVRSQAPGFWRVLAFDRYTGQGWEVSRVEEEETLTRPSWSYQFFIPNQTFVPRVRTKDVIQSYTAVADLPNVIAALAYPERLYFPTREVAIGPEGDLRSPLGLVDGLTYTVVSEVPFRDRTALGTASTDYPEEIQNYYLQVPPEIAAKVRQRTEEILATSPKPITSAYEKALFLAQALKQRYSIQGDLPFFAEDEDLVEAFLFKYEGGYPDHFPTVLTIMLRSIGIPARLATGFNQGDFNPFTGYYLVSNTDAQAITEVYFPGYGWFTFDPIPGNELIPPSIEENETFGVLRRFWNWVAGWLPSPVTAILNQLWIIIVGGLTRLFANLWRFFSSGLLGLFGGLIGAIAFVFLGWFAWNQLRSWSYQRRLTKLPPMARLYQQMLDLLAAKGYKKHPAQTPLEYADLSRQQHQEAVAEIIAEISQAYIDWRYGEKLPNTDYLRQQFQLLKRSFRRVISRNST
ncbi:transglutaminase TgpA family protein [Oscillatoria salina]|uniref:transglutaminase TgpA family protein n=1 Tax=Oscillatoria salina TaxID=331517 RepID=UPI0013B8F60C|nr:DUF4129 domain-containing transglutaminase family protein [Oscillatoria salina]MBZ8181717.1 DUF4129 domain-containing protein [Oscillatoria salina IIICB1]NET90363.1 DUF4129 domain-containing protein [Kamptonema sp. SIO1D9]